MGWNHKSTGLKEINYLVFTHHFLQTFDILNATIAVIRSNQVLHVLHPKFRPHHQL